MIPKKIWTMWLNPKPMPSVMEMCIASQRIPGYEHQVITLDNMVTESDYVRRAIEARKWVKASDFLRMEYLFRHGGVYLDADMEILSGKNFDHLLDCKAFISRDPMGHFCNAGLGSVPGNVLFKLYTTRLERNFVPEGNLVYDPGIRTFADCVWLSDKTGFMFPEADVFFPYNHLTGEEKVTSNTVVRHHYTTTWGYETHFIGKLVDMLIEKLKSRWAFIFVKRGDGEIACMNGAPGSNCDGHPYTPELGARLRSAFDFLKQYAYIVEFEDQQIYNSLMFRTDVDLLDVYRFWKAVQTCGRPVVFVGPKRLEGVCKLINAKFVEAPQLNAYAAYDDILSRLLDHVQDDAVFVFSCGMPAKVLIADLVRYNGTVTCIDAGSAFDPMLGQTRTNQITPEKFREIWKEEMEGR